METREITLDTGGSRPSSTSPASARGSWPSRCDRRPAHVFVPHATAAVVVVELGAGTEADVLAALDRLLPRDDRWRHAHGTPGHGADHVLPLLASPSLVVPVVDGRMTLGTWQSIALLDPNRDNSHRTVRLTFLSS
jgi:secondary thiamine-phosphate synthase enzyme